jgi:hypothetical protein
MRYKAKQDPPLYGRDFTKGTPSTSKKKDSAPTATDKGTVTATPARSATVEGTIKSRGTSVEGAPALPQKVSTTATSAGQTPPSEVIVGESGPTEAGIHTVMGGMDCLKEYQDHWGRLPKPTPIACEYKLGPTPLEAGDPFFMHRTARLDDVSRYPNGLNKLYLGETKTTSGSIGQCIEQYALHPQILLQMLLWKMDPKGEATYGPIEGVMLDVIKKGYGEESCSFAREAIPVPAFAMSWFPRTLKAWLRIFAAIDWDADVTRNPMRCTRSIGRATVACEFRELCKKGRAASNLYVMGKGVQLLKHEPEPGKMRMPWE